MAGIFNLSDKSFDNKPIEDEADKLISSICDIMILLNQRINALKSYIEISKKK